MNILILHRPIYATSLYHLAVDHNLHNIFYIGLEDSLKDIPATLKYSKIIRKKEDGILDCVVEFAKHNNITFDRVVSLSEYELMEAAQIREQLNIYGQKPKDIIKVRDKVLMKEIVKKAGILVPSFCELKDIINNKNEVPHSFSDEMIVVKPKDGAASSNIIAFTNIDSFFTSLKSKTTGIEALDGENQELAIDNFEVETFVDGDIYHIDGVMNNGEIALLQVSKYINTCLDYANGYPLGSVQVRNEAVYRDFADKVVKALGIVDSSFHLEIIQSNKKELYFLEIANRPGGGDIGKVFELKTGIHLQNASVLSMLGERVEIPNIVNNNFFGFFMFPSHKLKSPVVNIVSREALLQDRRLVSYNVNNAENLATDLSYRSSELPFSGLVTGTPEEMEEYLKLLFENTSLSEE